MENSIQNQATDDSIDLAELISLAWNDRFRITLITSLITIVAGAAAFVVPKKYEASVVVTLSSDNSSGQLGGLSALASQFGGLASLAGVSLSGDAKKSDSLAVLQSYALTEKFIVQNDLLPILYKNDWDANKNKWQETDPEKIPTVWKANQLFTKNIRTIANNTKAGTVTVTVKWRDAKIAADWANGLVRLANAYMRQRAIEQSEKNIAYLTDQSNKTDQIGIKQAIYAIMQSEINKAMLARGSDEYAFKVIDAAVPPEKQSSPIKSLWILAGFAVGLMISVFMAIVWPRRH